jgi:predicted nucleic acid-binding protein
MFVLDTNVLSTLMHPQSSGRAGNWVAAQAVMRLYTTAVCQAEVLSGLAVMAPGRRRAGLELAARGMFGDDFNGRILPFDSRAAAAYAEVLATSRRSGRPALPADLMIAAIAHVHDFIVVTRNVRDFEGCGVPLINPWDT